MAATFDPFLTIGKPPMQVLVSITQDQHYRALEAARRIDISVAFVRGKANAPLNAEAAKWLNSIWDRAEEALEHALTRGLAAARASIEQVSAKVSELLTLSAGWVDDLLEIVRSRLSIYFQEAFKAALGTVQKSVVVGGQEFPISEVTLTYSLKLSSSVEASLTKVCEFVAEGQIQLAAKYDGKTPAEQ